MSLVDLDQLSPIAIVSQYITETRGKSSFLTRDDITLVEQWLYLSNGSPEPLLLILEEQLIKDGKSKKFENKSPRSVKSLDKIVRSKIKASLSLRG